jgi:hypothetical protein
VNSVISELVCEHGTDPCAWTANGRLLAIVEALQQDENVKGGPELLSDCLIEMANDEKFRRSIIEALEHQNVAMRLAALGLAIERGLSRYVLEQLQTLAENNEGSWLAAAQEARVHQDAYSQRKAGEVA